MQEEGHSTITKNKKGFLCGEDKNVFVYKKVLNNG